uniref:Putative retrotransposon protein n=1 Tax=Tanacetum cinerariifolium TaxID=118510 RepID=A0A699IIC6_TANCI|nr:putative retrotransposon protein [Tanacetum cinerariifolium]
MKSYLDTLERLGYAMPNELGVSIILNSLDKDYDQFVQNYNMHSKGKTIAELHAMLKLHEKGIPKKVKTPTVLAIWEGKIQKDKRKLQGAKGHWRRNYPSYQAELKKRKEAGMASTLGFFTIELYAFPNKSWVYDTGCGTYIYNTLQSLRRSKKLKYGALSLYVGNGIRVAVEANKRIGEEIKKMGFTQNPDEPCVYLKASGSSVAFLILYVNEILLMGNNVTMLQEVKSWLCKYFSIKDLGEETYILGIKIICDRSKRLIALSQSAYLERILKKFKIENSKTGYTPMMEKPDYRKSQGAKTPSEVQHMQRVPYASAIGSIMYAVRCTIPDVAFAQNLCSRFQHNPSNIHYTAVKTILKYLRNTKDMVLVYREKLEAELKVSCYADASFQTDKDDTKSQTGYLYILNGGVVDWKSTKQSGTAMSSTEDKYIVAAETSMEAVWMRKFINRIGNVVPSNKRPLEMLCDNGPAIAVTADPGIFKGARHF